MVNEIFVQTDLPITLDLTRRFFFPSKCYENQFFPCDMRLNSKKKTDSFTSKSLFSGNLKMLKNYLVSCASFRFMKGFTVTYRHYHYLLSFENEAPSQHYVFTVNFGLILDSNDSDLEKGNFFVGFFFYGR